VLQEVLGNAPPAPDTQPEPNERFPGLLALGIAITIAYVWLLGVLGFALASALYIGAMIRVGRYRRWRVIVPTALAGSLAFMFMFQKIVYLSLPIGQSPFDALSLALMRLMGIR
jgi:putative tricarboxylic transport membrane protein